MAFVCKRKNSYVTIQRANSNEQVAKLRQHASPLSLFTGKPFFFFILYNSPTQKMPTAFFASDPGNRAIIHLL